MKRITLTDEDGVVFASHEIPPASYAAVAEVARGARWTEVDDPDDVPVSDFIEDLETFFGGHPV